MTRVTNFFNPQGSTSAHAYEQLPGEKSKMHAGARERNEKRKAELDREAASSLAPPYSLPPYTPGITGHTWNPTHDPERYYANASMHAT